MPDRYRIDCSTKEGSRVVHIGGKESGGDGDRWNLTAEEAIAGIEAGRWAFYVESGDGEPVDVVVTTEGGTKALSTGQAPGVPDALMALPPCPD